MTHAELIEKVARAIWSREGAIHGTDDRMFDPLKWEELDADEYQCIRDCYRDQARAAISECYRAMMEPTPEMEEAVRNSIAYDERYGTMEERNCIIAVVSASPLNGGRHAD